MNCDRNCTTQAGELCFCDGPYPMCRRISEPQEAPPKPVTQPTPTLKRLTESLAQSEPLDDNLKDINVLTHSQSLIRVELKSFIDRSRV